MSLSPFTSSSLRTCKPAPNRIAAHRSAFHPRRPLLSSRTVVRVFANEDPVDRPPSRAVSKDDACKILGVGQNSSFDQIMDAKKGLLLKAMGNSDKVADIEAAYDTLFMGAMQKRLGGSVSQQVRFADVPAKPKKVAAAPKFALPGGLGFKSPTQADVKTQVPIYATLAAWALLQAVLESSDAQLADTAGLQTALALLYASYTFKKSKGLELGKGVALSLGLLFLGIIVGSVLENWLRVDIVPIGMFSSPGVFVSEFAIFAVALGSLFVV